jgi:hypothetical protein
MMPLELVRNGVLVPAHPAVDLVLNSTYRGRGVLVGVGKAGLEAAEKRGSRIVWRFLNQAPAMSRLRKMTAEQHLQMGMAGRAIAEQRFDQALVIHAYLNALASPAKK